MRGLDGILPVDKPAGPTSHDIVATARRALGMRRIGHTGTLDPFASGLLLLCLGPSTRLAEYLTLLPKQYLATFRLGVVTDTDDSEGEVVSRSDAWRTIDAAAVDAALQQQSGSILQVPPKFSAKRVGGERMYAVARRGGEVKLEPVRVVVHGIGMLRLDPPLVDFIVDCSSGTYIRAIARDVGDALGVGAHLTSLRRTRVGTFEVANALSLTALAEPAEAEAALIAPARAVAHLPTMLLSSDEVGAVSHGGSIPGRADAVAGTRIALLTADGRLLGIGEAVGDRVHPKKVFA